MPIKDIIVVVDLAGQRAAMQVATDLAARTSAHLTGLSFVYQPMIPSYGMAPIPADFIASAIQSARDEAKSAAAAFSKAAERAGIMHESCTTDLLAGAGFEDIDRQCRVTDLVVIGQPDPDRPEPLREPLIESILFDTGAPVLVVPYIGAPQFKLDRALIAWDGSATAARAVHAALPLLTFAKQVEVLMLVSGEPEEGAGVGLARYLARHNLRTELKRTTRGGVGVADALLNYVADNAYDWVVMGAYGHSRLREAVFGGATRDVLAEMTVPVLMTH
jgi:nucleotide-binding universal stress UspA family protein